MKKPQFAKIKCQCGHTNLVPVFKALCIEKATECEGYGKLIIQKGPIHV